MSYIPEDSRFEERPKAIKSWQRKVYDLLKDAGVTHFSYVPDAGHAQLIEWSASDPDVYSIPLSTEEEGVGISIGAHLGGGRSVLLMQSSGVGNCVNALALVKGGGFPFFTLVSMRGDFGEGNPMQVPMGQATRTVLEASGITCLCIDDEKDVEQTIKASLVMNIQSELSVAVLLGQKLLGAKKF
ncbi:MAG: phosphonopyruvate decarboxylase [Hyphomicrobiaceae bacterium]|nr:phosphonopyruvate decarboxylase [Hyphomicrobiaceae bacterium]